MQSVQVFLGIGLLSFSEFQHGAGNPHQVMSGRAMLFFVKLFFASKIWQVSQNRIF